MHERGPEAVRPMVDEFFRRCSEIIVAHDGIVDHFLGDAVLGLFNAPIRRNDHAAQAVSAATEIQQAVPQINRNIGEEGLLQVGIGISTGMVYAGVVGSNNCSDYTALGDAVNIASRLQGEADAGEILVSEQTYDEMAEPFPHTSERLFELKGISKPVRAFSLT